jgi:hypothetical protein
MMASTLWRRLNTACCASSMWPTPGKVFHLNITSNAQAENDSRRCFAAGDRCICGADGAVVETLVDASCSVAFAFAGTSAVDDGGATWALGPPERLPLLGPLGVYAGGAVRRYGVKKSILASVRVEKLFSITAL